VLAPGILARVKQPTQRPSVGIDSGDIWALKQVAREASDSQIFRLSQTAMLLGNHVIDLKRRRLEFLPNAAILTGVVRSSPNKLV
jgi:hypothetical protein